MREQQIQTRKIKELEAQGYYVIKLINTNKNGIPDLLAIPPGSDVLFVEVKAPNGKLSKLQEFRIKEIQSYDIKVEVHQPRDTITKTNHKKSTENRHNEGDEKARLC